MLRKIFTVLAVLSFCAPSFAESSDGFDFKGVIRYRLESDFVAKTTKNDFDFTYFQATKKFGENLSMTFAPGIIRNNSINTTAAVKNDTLDFVLYAANFKFNDVTKNCGDYGIELIGGQYFSPFYLAEQYYQPFKFIEKPLDFRLFPNNITPLGVVVNKNFVGDAVRTSVAYVSGAGAWNSELFPSTYNDNVNAGGVNAMLAFFPFRQMGDALKEFSITANVMAVARTSARSNYNILFGYKYGKLATSLEYAHAYSRVASNKISAISFGTSYDVVGPLQALARYDYTDIKNTSMTFVPTPISNFFLLGLNTKWYEGHFQVAATFDMNYNPSTKVTATRRFMIATQTLI